MSRSGTRRSRWTRTGSTAGWWMPSWSPTNRRPRRWCWIWMRPTTRSMASRKAGSFTVTTATTVISRCTSSRGEHLLCARLRCSNIDGAAGSVEELERIVGRIRQSWPEVSIVIRADSGFCRDDLLRWCEDHHVDYVMGLANNDRLKSERAEAMTQAEAEFNATGRPARVFKDFRYRTRHSWTSERRGVGKAEFLDKGANPRFVVTSLSPERLGARASLRRLLLCAGRHGEPHKRTAVGSVRRPDQRGNDGAPINSGCICPPPPTCSCTPCVVSD